MFKVKFDAAILNLLCRRHKAVKLLSRIALVIISVEVGRGKVGEHSIDNQPRQLTRRDGLVYALVGVCVKADSVHSGIELNMYADFL